MSETGQEPAPGPQQPLDDRDYVTITFDFRMLVISLFVVWQLFAVGVWLLPEGTAPRNALTPIVGDYMLFTGCWQQWTMFSPDPARTDAYIVAEVRYADGKQTSFNYYRMHDLSYTARYQRERWRKMIENVLTPDGIRIYPYVARYAAIVCAPPGPGVYPVTVTLVRHYRYIPPPPYHALPFASNVVYTQSIASPPLGGASSS